MVLGSESLELRTAGAWALMRLGVIEGTADAIVSTLAQDETYMPSILIDLYRRAPDAVRPAIERGLRSGTVRQREVLTWIVAVLHDPALVALVDPLRNDEQERVRNAASYAVSALDIL
jgi:hypothetical protein